MACARAWRARVRTYTHARTHTYACTHIHIRTHARAHMELKVAPSFWFFNMSVLIFCCNSFKIVSGGRGSNFVAVHRQNVDQIAYLFLYAMLLEKAVFFLKKKSQNGRWPQLFSPKMCSVEPVLPEELKNPDAFVQNTWLLSCATFM